MHFIENIRVREKCTQARFGTEQDRLPAIGGAWIVLRIGIAEDPPAKRDELFMFFAWRNRSRHFK